MILFFWICLLWVFSIPSIKIPEYALCLFSDEQRLSATNLLKDHFSVKCMFRPFMHILHLKFILPLLFHENGSNGCGKSTTCNDTTTNSAVHFYSLIIYIMCILVFFGQLYDQNILNQATIHCQLSRLEGNLVEHLAAKVSYFSQESLETKQKIKDGEYKTYLRFIR